MNNDLLNKLSDDDFFKKFVTEIISHDLTVILDGIVTDRHLSYTQKQQLANYRDDGTLNKMMLGDFDSLPIGKIIEVFSIFGVGIRLQPVTKKQLSYDKEKVTRH